MHWRFCLSCLKNTVNIEIYGQLSKWFLSWLVCRRLNFYRREGIFSFFVIVPVGSVWKMASSCCKLWLWLARAVCGMCLTLCGWLYMHQICQWKTNNSKNTSINRKNINCNHENTRRNMKITCRNREISFSKNKIFFKQYEEYSLQCQEYFPQYRKY